MRVEPGSFRDSDSRVLLTDRDEVFRALSPQGLEDWRALRSSAAFEDLIASGALVGSWEVDGERPAVLPQVGAGLLRHERVPYVSYPYEWTFGMLRDAAVLELDILDRCLQEGLILKDGSPYNVQWWGVGPVHIDVGSFERLRAGEPWAGYRQFCMLFLYPLMLQAYRGIPFQPWLRGAIDGIAPHEARAVMSLRDLLRRGVLTHVVLHARLERRYAAAEGRAVRRELSHAGFRTELIRANVRRLRRLVERMRWAPGHSGWTDYREQSAQSARDAEAKVAFVAEAVGRRSWDIVWDLGCNDGAFARLAAPSARTVVAMDADHPTVERLYQTLRAEPGSPPILPLVVDVCDPSPDRGWRGRERGALVSRGRPDLTLCLALVHHLAIADNVPLAEIVAWLEELGGRVVVELPTPQDPMVRRLLAAKRDGAHSDYGVEQFERRLQEAFEIERSELLPCGTRVLYEARPRHG